jgi:hypothetical protein
MREGNISTRYWGGTEREAKKRKEGYWMKLRQ